MVRFDEHRLRTGSLKRRFCGNGTGGIRSFARRRQIQSPPGRPSAGSAGCDIDEMSTLAQKRRCPPYLSKQTCRSALVIRIIAALLQCLHGLAIEFGVHGLQIVLRRVAKRARSKAVRSTPRSYCTKYYGWLFNQASTSLRTISLARP
jgi:hypothetical protein